MDNLQMKSWLEKQYAKKHLGTSVEGKPKPENKKSKRVEKPLDLTLWLLCLTGIGTSPYTPDKIKPACITVRNLSFFIWQAGELNHCINTEDWRTCLSLSVAPMAVLSQSLGIPIHWVVLIAIAVDDVDESTSKMLDEFEYTHVQTSVTELF